MGESIVDFIKKNDTRKVSKNEQVVFKVKEGFLVCEICWHESWSNPDFTEVDRIKLTE